MVLNSAEAEEMFKCANKNNVLLMEAMWAMASKNKLTIFPIVFFTVLPKAL